MEKVRCRLVRRDGVRGFQLDDCEGRWSRWHRPVFVVSPNPPLRVATQPPACSKTVVRNSYLPGHVHEQPFKHSSHDTRLIDLGHLGCHVGRKHGAQGRIVPHERVHAELGDLADNFAEKLNVAVERCLCGVGRAYEDDVPVWRAP